MTLRRAPRALFRIPAMAATVAAMALMATALTVAPASAATAVIDDDETGTGLNQFEFTDGWGTSAGLPPESYEGGTEHWANHAGPGFTLRFSGSRVHLYGVTDAYQGIYSVTVDGGATQLVDGYSADRLLRQRIFDSGPLADGEHTVTLTLTETRNPASSRYDGQIDYAVVDPVLATGISMESSALSVAVGQSVTSTAAVLPAGAHDRAIDWSSSDPDVATVDAYGVVRGVASGAVTLTGTTHDGGFAASREISVHAIPATAISMDTTPVALKVNQSRQLSAEVLPSDAADRAVLWSSSDETIATVSPTGLLAARGPGSATITATTRDGGFTASLTAEIGELDGGLHGSVGDSNVHYVLDNSYADYPREDYADIIALDDISWSGTAWKGDTELGQFVYWAGRDGTENLQLEASDLTTGDGAVIGADRVDLTFIDTILAGRGAPPGQQDPIPDVLGARTSASLESGDIQPVWMSIDVPVEAQPGTYDGTITATDASGAELEFDLRLEVLDVTLPDPTQWTQFVDIWQNPFAAAKAAGIADEDVFTPVFFDAVREHYDLLGSIGQKVITTSVVEDPWASSGFEKYRSMVEWTRHDDGTWSFDFSDFDAWVEFMFEVIGPDAQIDAYSMLSYGEKIRYTDAETGEIVDLPIHAFTPEWEDGWGAFLSAFGSHLTSKGWFDLTYLAADEVPIAKVLPLREFIDSIPEAAGMKLATATNYASMLDPRLDKVAKVSVVGSQVWIADADFRAMAQARKDKGLITTIYNCTGVFPNSFTRSAPAEGVWFQWKTIAAGTDGYLRWAFDNYNARPLVTTDSSGFESGDSFLVYPDAVSSVRFEKLAQGVRDAAKVRFALELGGTTAEQVQELLGTLTDTDSATDPELGGMIDPGIVDIPAEVDRIEARLDDIVRSHGAVSVSGIAAIGGDRSLEVGSSTELHAQVSPAIASDQRVTWSSSDPSVVSIENGAEVSSAVRVAASTDAPVPTATAVSEGTAVLTATSADGGFTSTFTVTVVAGAPVEPGGGGGGTGSTQHGGGAGSAAHEGLAHTGQDIVGSLVAAAIVILAGGMALAIRRRRRVGRGL